MQDATKANPESSGMHIEYVHTLDGRKLGRPNVLLILQDIKDQLNSLEEKAAAENLVRFKILLGWIGGWSTFVSLLVWIF